MVPIIVGLLKVCTVSSGVDHVSQGKTVAAQ
jgi:hypothetical protein